MTENPETEAAPAAPKPSPVDGFKAMKNTEKILAIAAVATFVAFVFANRWDDLFYSEWFPTCAFLGALGVKSERFHTTPAGRPMQLSNGKAIAELRD